MPKKPVSLTLDETNLLWLKGRARVLAGGSLSEAVDRLIDEARAGRLGEAEPPRSVVGTIDLPDEEVLHNAGAEMRALFDASRARPVFVHEEAPPYRAPRTRKR
jgi:hypothetical protein